MEGPSGYEKHYVVETPCRDARVAVGPDTTSGSVDRFLVQLRYDTSVLPLRTVEIARIDHNPASPLGHDLYAEGLHVDVRRPDGSEAKAWPPHTSLPTGAGALITACIGYYRSNVEYFVGVYEGAREASDPPAWR